MLLILVDRIYIENVGTRALFALNDFIFAVDSVGICKTREHPRTPPN